MFLISHLLIFSVRHFISYQNLHLTVKGVHPQKIIFVFFYKCLKHNIIDPNVICRLFTLTFQGQVKYWFDSFLANSIHSFSEFVIEFLSYFYNYDYDELSEELSFLRKENGESFNDFAIRFIHVCTRFPLKEMSLNNEWFEYLISLLEK